MSRMVLQAESLRKIYRRGREEVRALHDVSLEIQRGEFVAVTGPSGAGKTTLLNILGCMDAPTSGLLRIDGREAQALRDHERTKLRREKIGFVFQHFGLIPTLTVAENVALPAFFARGHAAHRTDELLQRVGLAHRRSHRPHELSGGEMQRAAIARALVNNPALILADEPTGNLDTLTSQSVIALFQKLHRDGMTLVIVTHNAALADAAGRQVRLVDGVICGG